MPDADKPTDTGPIRFRPARTEPRADHPPVHGGPGDGDRLLLTAEHAAQLARKRLEDWRAGHGRRN